MDDKEVNPDADGIKDTEPRASIDISKTYSEVVASAKILKENMVLESDRVTIVFDDLSYVVKIRKNREVTEKFILKGVSGAFKQGRLTAVMGASGAG